MLTPVTSSDSAFEEDLKDRRHVLLMCALKLKVPQAVTLGADGKKEQ